MRQTARKTVLMRRWIDLAVAAAMLLGGCTAPNLPQSSPTPEAALTPSPLPEITATRTARPTVTRRPTATVTRTATPTPTLVYLPTLSPEEAQEEIARLMRTNNDCEGNCVWGFRAGESRYDEAIRYLKSIRGAAKEDIRSQRQDAWVSFHFRDYARVGLHLWAKKNILQQIEIEGGGLQLPGSTTEDWLAFRPDMVLRRFGPPNQVNVLMATAPEGRINYEMIWFYDQMYITYSAGRNQIIILPQHILHACPLVDHNIDRFRLISGPYSSVEMDRGDDLTRVTSLTVEDFSQILTGDPAKACFDLDYNAFNR